jgi:protein-S-isoprenylcysteine O-methyltransferase Ste14
MMKTKRKILTSYLLALLVLGLAFFLPARTFNYWEAWLYLGIIFSCAAVVILYFLHADPSLLERRMKTRENVKEQKLIIRLAWLLFIPTYVIPGFDKYYGWSHIPSYLVIISAAMVLIGYIIVVMVFKENSYASRVIEIDSTQKVISTGPYALVRHPMYSGMMLMYGFTPMALGSYWALTGTIVLYMLMIARMFNEEKFLVENLDGYKEYLQKTKYRVIPGVW